MRINKYLLIFIGISAFLAIYLSYVHYDRKQSIQKYIGQPKAGDIYKIETKEEDGKWLHYYKIHSIENEKIVFTPAKMKADASADYILKHFQTDEFLTYSSADLKEISEGKWDNFQKDNTVLVEIIRKE